MSVPHEKRPVTRKYFEASVQSKLVLQDRKRRTRNKLLYMVSRNSVSRYLGLFRNISVSISGIDVSESLNFFSIGLKAEVRLEERKSNPTTVGDVSNILSSVDNGVMTAEKFNFWVGLKHMVYSQVRLFVLSIWVSETWKLLQTTRVTRSRKGGSGQSRMIGSDDVTYRVVLIFSFATKVVQPGSMMTMNVSASLQIVSTRVGALRFLIVSLKTIWSAEINQGPVG